MNTSNNTTEAIRNFFTETEWEAIERSLADFPDLSEDEQILKTYQLFEDLLQ